MKVLSGLRGSPEQESGHRLSIAVGWNRFGDPLDQLLAVCRVAKRITVCHWINFVATTTFFVSPQLLRLEDSPRDLQECRSVARTPKRRIAQVESYSAIALENQSMKESQANPINTINRRGFLGMGLGLATASLVQTGSASPSENVQKSPEPIGRRMLGKLEVSAIGMGVQNMHRKYDTSVPYRPEMVAILRAAFDGGVTFFDCAEAYGPWENERILGEAIAPFRDKVQITSKFGWNIDPETGQRRPGLNSKPDHVKRAVDAMLSRLRTDRIDLLYQHRVDPEVPIEDVAGAIKDLMSQGKVRNWGLSEPGLQTVRRAHRELPLTAIDRKSVV